MIAIPTRYEHVVVDEAGVAMIAGTTMKVLELVIEQRAYGWSPEELYFQHPYLSLGQIYSSLAYYWDHQKELDEAIERQLERADQLRQFRGPTPFEVRLKQQGLG